MNEKKMTSLNRVNLYEQIADYMEKLILDEKQEEWNEGSKLPPEQELADYFDVSRNVIREAIKSLKERGLVEPKNGVGVYVTKPDVQKLSSLIYRMVLMDDIDVKSIYDVRTMMETYTAGLAATVCSEEELQHMRKLLSRMEDRSISINERRETDYAFHVAIAEATKNPLLLLMVSAMKDVFIAMIEKGIFVRGGIEDACKRHEKIMRSLENHDADAAREAMQEHLEVSCQSAHTYDNNSKNK